MPISICQAHRVRVAVFRHALVLGLQVACAALPVMVHSAAAQGTIRGRVWNASTGAPLGGVNIIAIGTALSTFTNSLGEYTLILPPGPRTIRASVIGFSAQTRDVTTPPGQTVTIDFTLVSVNAPPPGDEPTILVPLVLGQEVPTSQLRFSLPDSARIRHRQMAFVPFDPARGGTLHLPLFPDVNLRIRADRITRVTPGHFRWSGKVLDPLGFTHGTARLVLLDGRLTGVVRIDTRVFQILPHNQLVHLVIETNPANFVRGRPPLPPLPPPRPPLPPFPDVFFPEMPFFQPPPWFAPFPLPLGNACSDLPNLTSDRVHEIRLLVLYTPQVDSKSSDILADIDLMILDANEAMLTGEIPLRFELAQALSIDANDNGTIGGPVQLSRLENPADNHLDVVHTWRNQHHADITVLLLANQSYGEARMMGDVTVAHEKSAFALVAFEYAIADLTFAHEVGHILGAQHERASSPLVMHPYHYNYDFILPGLTPLTLTIMAYSGTASLFLRLPNYSNPDLWYSGQRLGVASTDPNAADNRRTFTQTGSVVSAFRLTPVWFVSTSATAPWSEKRVSEDPMSSVRFGDFDGDRETDAFRVDAATNTWWWSRSASEPWLKLNGSLGIAVDIDRLAFGDFNGDGKTDVFRSDVATGTWFWSPGGVTSWQTLNGPNPGFALPLSELRFADFDGGNNPTTDVFRTNAITGEWFISKGGSAPWLRINGPSSLLSYHVSDLVLGDFDGDLKADVFRASRNEERWYWSKNGSTTWDVLKSNEWAGIDVTAFGNFIGDARTDAFRADGINWLVSDGAKGNWTVLRPSCHQLASLRFGDFDGDGVTDVMRSGIRP